MASRRISVDITGDPTNLERALNRASASVRQFGANVRKGAVAAPLEGLEQGFDKLDNKLRLRARRAQSLGPLRLAGIGLGAGTALFAATQAAAKLGDAIEVTGQQAQTAGGRMRNFASSLAGGDIVGAITAIGHQADTLEEAGISAQSATLHYQSFKAVLASGFEGPLSKIAQEAVHLTEVLRAQEAGMNALADATARLGTVFVTTSGQAVEFKGAVDDLAGARGPGGVNQINANLAQARGGRYGRPGRLPDIAGTSSQASLILAQARGDLPEVLRLEKANAERARRVFEKSSGNRKQHSEQRIKLAQAEAAVIETQNQIDAEALVAANKAKSDAEDRRRKAKATAEKAARDAEAARKRWLDALEDAARSAKEFQQKLQRNAEAIRDAAVNALGRRQEGRDIAREIQEKTSQLALAKRIGSPTAIKQARQELVDARTDRLRFMLEGAKVKPTRVLTPGRAPGYAFSGTTVHIGNLTLSGVQNPKQLLRELQRIPTATSRRGRYGGTKHGI